MYVSLLELAFTSRQCTEAHLDGFCGRGWVTVHRLICRFFVRSLKETNTPCYPHFHHHGNTSRLNVHFSPFVQGEGLLADRWWAFVGAPCCSGCWFVSCALSLFLSLCLSLSVVYRDEMCNFWIRPSGGSLVVHAQKLTEEQKWQQSDCC